MAHETMSAERGRDSTSTEGLRLAGALWVAAGACCAGLLVVVFVGENLILQNPGLSALFLGGAIAAFLTGGLLLARPGPRVVRWSTIVGAAWLIAFGALMVNGLVLGGPDRDGGPLLSLALVTGFGVAGALVAYWSRRSGRLTEQ